MDHQQLDRTHNLSNTSYTSANGNTSSSSLASLVPGGVVTTQNISRVIKPKENNKSMQFVKITPPDLSKKAAEQIRVAQESKITKDKLKEVEEEWQSNLMKWKSKRRQHFVGPGDGSANEDDSNNNELDAVKGRKVKTFAQMIEQRSKANNRLNFNLRRYIGSGEEDEGVDEESGSTEPGVQQELEHRIQQQQSQPQVQPQQQPPSRPQSPVQLELQQPPSAPQQQHSPPPRRHHQQPPPTAPKPQQLPPVVQKQQPAPPPIQKKPPPPAPPIQQQSPPSPPVELNKPSSPSPQIQQQKKTAPPTPIQQQISSLSRSQLPQPLPPDQQRQQSPPRQPQQQHPRPPEPQLLSPPQRKQHQPNLPLPPPLRRQQQELEPARKFQVPAQQQHPQPSPLSPPLVKPHQEPSPTAQHQHQLPPPRQPQQPQIPPPPHQSQKQPQQPTPKLKEDKDRTVLSVSGKRRCSSCKEELGRGAAAFVVESLNLVYHTNCFKCSVCHVDLSNGFRGVDVRVHAGALHCQNCYSKDGLNYSRV